MIETFHIQGFRRFADYRLNDLRRVNLLVGDNNCGKTSLLEALHVLTSRDEHTSLRRAAYRRGEIQYLPVEEKPDEVKSVPTLQNFFFGSEIQPGSVIELSSGLRTCRIRVHEPTVDLVNRVVGPYRDLIVETAWGGPNIEFHALHVYFGCSSKGAVDSVRLAPHGYSDHTGSPVQFVDLEMTSHRLRTLWDKIVKHGNESLVIEAMKVIVPEMRRIHFGFAEPFAPNPRIGIQVDISQRESMSPIGSLGGGAFHVLQLACGLVHCSGGTFLIDELDTGIHWSRMSDMWRVVIDTAIQNDTQVFATTHSADCVNGLASVCDIHSELAEHVAVHTIRPELTELGESIVVPGERLTTVIGAEIEVR